VMGLIFTFGMIYGVGTSISSYTIQLCTLLLIFQMLEKWIICLWQEVWLIRMYSFTRYAQD